MTETLKNLPQTERFRQYLLQQAKQGTIPEHREGWTPVEEAHGIANGMPWIYGFLDQLYRIVQQNKFLNSMLKNKGLVH